MFIFFNSTVKKKYLSILLQEDDTRAAGDPDRWPTIPDSRPWC